MGNVQTTIGTIDADYDDDDDDDDDDYDDDDDDDDACDGDAKATTCGINQKQLM